MNCLRDLPQDYLDLCPLLDEKYKLLFKLGFGRFSKYIILTQSQNGHQRQYQRKSRHQDHERTTVWVVKPTVLWSRLLERVSQWNPSIIQSQTQKYRADCGLQRWRTLERSRWASRKDTILRDEDWIIWVVVQIDPADIAVRIKNSSVLIQATHVNS